MVVFKMYSAFFCVFTMYSTGWAKSRRALDCFFTIMAEILGRYWQILDRSDKKIILLSSLFTASTIQGLQKLGLVAMVSYHYRLHVPIFKMFLTLPKFEWSCFSWPNFDLDCCNLLKYLQIMQIWMTLFQFAQMARIVPKFE